MKLLTVAGIVLVFNIPFGYWRANTKKFSLKWFLAIHVPVPVVVISRIIFGLGWRLVTFPVLLGAFVSGQFLGGRLYHWRLENRKSRTRDRFLKQNE
ncbi:MAG: hypothetical protein V1736_14050 [Pseudomonadota bacterium]